MLAKTLMVTRTLKRRRGFTLIELVTVCILIGLMSTVAVSNIHSMQDNSANASASGNARAVAQALEKFRSDRAALPKDLNVGADTANAVLYLCAGKSSAASTVYLPGNQLPQSPWGSAANVQTNDVAYGFSVDANAAAQGTKPKTLVNNAATATTGTLPSSGTYTAGTYGLLQYSANTLGDIYVVTVMGKHGGKALVVEAVTNAN